jgi:hypothetical protein
LPFASREMITASKGPLRGAAMECTLDDSTALGVTLHANTALPQR